MFLVAFNMYLGIETDQVLCQMVKSYSCTKYENLIKIAYNLMLAPIILTGF
jgi:hypothetical protein